ncbi:MAG: isomerase [Alphaproteobacteria bacterium HGW-Alphaproteobacteria-2]|nr:MAG: isomerase [Alphaproteobacteria bacterium HGW-Alphaproteobacteria-2]
MRISANLGFLYTDMPLVERVHAAARDGFHAVEFHWPYDTDPALLSAALAETGLPGLALNTRRGDVAVGEFGLAAVPGREAEARAQIAEAVEYAAAAGLGAVHVMAGRAVGPEAERCFVGALAFAAERASRAGVGLLIEPLNTRDVPGYFLTGTAQARRIAEAVGWHGLGIMYDFYHMQIMQGDHLATLAGLGPLVAHYQIAAVPGRGEPDRGEIDFSWLLPQIGGGDICVGAEYRPTIPPGDWLRRFLCERAG